MENLEITTCEAVQTQRLGRALGKALSPGDAVLLNGDLGAGKTQFAKGVGQGLGVSEDITSPTFNIVSVYSSGRIPLNHLDVYRLDDSAELEDIDFYSIVDSTSVGASLIEWAQKFEDEMPDDCLEISITHGTAASERLLSAAATGQRSSSLLDAWNSMLESEAS